jgi:hypothetical protein
VGKGLKAGMLVALLVGAIRTATDTSLDPEFVLGVLNKRLLRRGDAQATCLALSIAKDGEATLRKVDFGRNYASRRDACFRRSCPEVIRETYHPINGKY